ncbi:sulfotransferase [Luteimonas sp. 50]|uniref:Sulfotransferase n=1 Tax=Cognatiluteimonas sedimenti TaxID=2927791 RepID=A0ABT0A2F1_9GAMM|nr:tetratricopeptide repeat-containing sulfotransferase family protein [Lysobacter sedimenti]MCJ0825174.1 sulfotransferase [Lysobacter sedimenti]
MGQVSAESKASVEGALRHAVADPVLLEAGRALVDNDIPHAETLLRERLRRSPTDVAAIRMLAEVAARIGRYEDATHLLERCLELAPGFAAARQNYAMVLHRSNRPQEALAEVERLLASDPDNPGYRNLRAVVLCRTGDFDEAIELYEGILADHPGQSRVWLSQGHALKTAGQAGRAIAAYRRCIDIEPGFGDAWWSLANLKTFRFDDADLATMRAQLGRTDLGDEDRLHLDFALGKALEDRGEYADAFAHYSRGNALRLVRTPYSADANSARLQRATEIYTSDFFQARAGYGVAAADPIFIVGMPRAGSTLVEQILSSHPLVEGTMELPELTSLTRVLRLQGAGDGPARYHEVLAGLDADAVRELGERYLERTRIQRKSGAPFFIDKMPNNFAHIGLIRLALPDAKVIDVRRHPLACGFSLFKQQFARGQDFSYSLGDIGRYYRDYVGLMAHFDQALPGYVHRVAYEALVEDTETEVRRLLDHCGLPFAPQCLRFFENDRPVRTASSEQVRQPIYRAGVDHWTHFEPWLEPLKAALGPVLDAWPAAPVPDRDTTP